MSRFADARADIHASRLRPGAPWLGILALTAVFAVAACDDEPLAPRDGSNTTIAADAPALNRQQVADPFVPGRVLVRFTPGADVGAVTASAGAAVRRDMVLGIKVLDVPVGREATVARALSANPNVEFAEPDYVRTFGDLGSMPVNDAFVGYKWDLDNDGNVYDSQGNVLATTGATDADMDWREAVEALAGATGAARIGIMDTGIRNDHEELQGRVAAQFDFFAGDADAEDDNGHGTHVAGIAAANTDNGVGTAGVAYTGTVEFVIAKVCGRSNPGRFGYGCPTSAIADGIVFAVDNGAHVLNLSLGGSGGSTATRSALQYARSLDVLPFCAAGNENGPVSYPAAWPECVAVSATDWGDDLASYSNFGPEVELAAPGGDSENRDGYSYILSSYHEGPSSYVLMAGTSMASPQAAGLGALLHVLGVTDDGDKLARMKSTADDLGPAGTDDRFGAGRINVYAAATGQEPDDGGGGTTNLVPTASFTYSCTELSCSFDGSGSTDDDGSIVGYAWDFGDGNGATGVTTSHTYASDGTRTVTLTVTDDGGATGSTSEDVTVSATPPEGGITLTATGYKTRGLNTVDLTWSRATSANVDIFRDGTLITTTTNDGAHTDSVGERGSATYAYRLCETGTTTCSSEVTVIF